MLNAKWVRKAQRKPRINPNWRGSFIISRMDTYLEIGTKRVFAGAVEWPGWSRSGRDELSALQALLAYGPRYARVMQFGALAFDLPVAIDQLRVIERLPGGPATNFGVPEKALSADARPVDEAELAHLQAVLTCCWQALNASAQAAQGRQLSKGPRGGGRELEGVLRHVLDAEASYLGRIGWKVPKWEDQDLPARQEQTLQNMLEGLAAAVRQGVPPSPRGGARWLPRYYARRSAWHILDHAWEIEDRII
jgi:hypothetical protein